MLEIHFVEREITNPSAKIVWCADKETMKQIEEIPDPFLLISVIPNSGTEEKPIWNSRKQFRALFPFKDGVGYLSLFSKGQNKIQAIVLRGPLKDLKDRFMGRDSGEYRSDVINSNAEMFEDGYAYSRWIRNDAPHTKSMLVDVPDGIFAPEPPQWEKNWVLWLLNDKGVDQCSYRKRRLFAYLVQPFILFGRQLIILAATLLSLLLGMRGFSLCFLLHPLTIDLVDVFGPSGDRTHGLLQGGSIFIRPLSAKLWSDLNGDVINSGITIFKMIATTCWSLFFLPPILIGVVALSILKVSLLLEIMKFFVICILVLFSVVAAIGVAEFFVMRSKKKKLLGQSEPRLLKVPVKFDDLICTGEIKLPKKQSVKLHFLDLKSRVCRPFSR